MADDVKSFIMNVQKKIRQQAAVKMQQKMEHAAAMVVAKADSERGFDNVTGNLYKSIAVGTFYKGNLESIYHTPGPNPTRPTLAKGETYNLARYYQSPVDIKMTGRKPFVGRFGRGGQSGADAAEDTLFSMEYDGIKNGMTWMLALVAGVEYANYVEKVKGHNVISSLSQYMARYFRKM